MARRGACLVVAALAAASLTALRAPSAGAYPYADVTLEVHGYGGGEGMGQWGALGYALVGTTYSQILEHYYGTLSAGGTTHVGVPAGWSDGTVVSVALTENGNGGNEDVIVRSDTAFTAGGVSVPANGAARFHYDGTSWTVGTSQTVGANSCGGPWNTDVPVSGGPVAVPGAPETFPGNVGGVALTLCYVGGNLTVRGNIEGTVNSSNQTRAVDLVALGPYVADVTPSESPASWGTLGSAGPQGQNLGFQELEAQAVAARSYVMNLHPGGYFGYADVCDTPACQNYPGIANENSLTDLATTDTAGVAVLSPAGAPTLTQYSASTGGYSAPGTFAAVVDAGDSVCVTGACNPYHAYAVQIPVSAIVAKFPQLGTLVSVGVPQRNGLGDFGGRVLAMELEGSAQTVTLSGATFASDFASYGLDGVALSNWFALEGQPSGGIGGYWLAAADGGVFSFGDA
ncbi:MAG TPA: SpoIID/LytB domain-containing protein, partial [Acidimicrobiales bacterium]|nr:SpoIID/LytB domain-containing protein [Acidimicrobiales bacterium]